MSIFAAVSPNGWAHALAAHKCANKVTLACEAANRRDFREREFGSPQQILGARFSLPIGAPMRPTGYAIFPGLPSIGGYGTAPVASLPPHRLVES
jgi:hypothetical protein